MKNFDPIEYGNNWGIFVDIENDGCEKYDLNKKNIIKNVIVFNNTKITKIMIFILLIKMLNIFITTLICIAIAYFIYFVI
jgi:hypothetical protein